MDVNEASEKVSGQITTDDQDKLRSKFFERSEMFLSIFDKDLYYVDVNEAFYKKLRLNRNEIVGKHITEIFPDVKSSGRLEIYKEVIRTGKTFTLENVKLHPSLGNIHIHIKAFKVDGGLGISGKDITDLVVPTYELEDFIYRISHDMRNPITSILGWLNLVDTKAKDMDEAKYFCKTIKHEADRLDNIVRILVEATNIRTYEMAIHLINFNEIINEVIRSFEFASGFKEIKFETDISIDQNFYSDKLLITRLLKNLIDNSIKYRKENANDAFIKISIVDENNEVKITVADNGIGISDNLQKDIFKLFYRASEKSTGIGLGLYTVNKITKKLEGQIKFSSKEKEGTSFTIYLPYGKIGGQPQYKML
ncbi:MAG: PAS domain-containing sensor histidine kinase [Bacteroidota bacterium]